MSRLLLIYVHILLASYCSAQSDNLTGNILYNHQVVKNTDEKTLILNISGIPLLTFESLKEELISWKEKVKSIEINDITHEFTLIHYSILENRELFDVLSKYGIEKNTIKSYK